jgi:hypothetical protein
MHDTVTTLIFGLFPLIVAVGVAVRLVDAVCKKPRDSKPTDNPERKA